MPSSMVPFKTKLMRPLTLLFFIIAAFLLAIRCHSPNKEQVPNIILLFADDMGYGDLGVYGHPTIRTPNLDHLAATGVKFTNFYSGSPACTASRYALLTGRYPVHSGFSWVLYPFSPKGIHPKETTLAEGLQSQGYATGIFGKWHLGTTETAFLPLQNGFDEYLGLPYSNDMIPPNHPPIPLMDGNDTLEVNPDQSTLTQRYTARALSFIQKNKDQPFFCYLPFAMPHLPLHPGKAFEGSSSRGTYGDVVEEIDHSLGQIISRVEELGLAENTLIFFTSDNGPWIIKKEKGGSAGLLKDGKGSTWEGGMRVPAIGYMAGKTPKGSVVQTPVSTLDLYTSFLKMGNYNFLPEHHKNGRDIRALLFQKSDTLSEQPFFYYGPGSLHAVRLGKWKLHVRTSSQTKKKYFEGKVPLLFDLSTDPSEQYDLSASQPEIVAKLTALIDQQNEYVASHPDYFKIEREQSKSNHLGVGKSVALNYPPAAAYNNVSSLTDGFKESPAAFNHLAGFEGVDFEGTIDLETVTPLNEISIGFLKAPRSWIFLPQQVSISTSIDGVRFTPHLNQTVQATQDVKEETRYFTTETLKVSARYIKINAKNGGCPDWHDGHGKACWLFADEIITQ